jgi:hypothetical protein
MTSSELKFTLSPSEGRILRFLLQYQAGNISKEELRFMFRTEGINDEYIKEDEHLEDAIKHWDKTLLTRIG